MKNQYVEFSTFLKKKYGEVVYRIPIDIGFSCPNRTGFRGQGGCTFCSGDGARARHLINKYDLVEQIQSGIFLAQERYQAKKFMAYFQAYTSTYAPIEKIRELFEVALSAADFDVVVISTRPDCLPEPVLTYLAELAQRYDLWVELGVQTIHDETLKRINRGHDFACSKKAINILSQYQIKVAAHVILGLPGETESMMLETAKTLACLPLSGIKIHNLHIIKNTVMAEEFVRGEIKVLDEQEYGEILMKFLRYLPSDWPIMRLVAETPWQELIAPRWWLNKGQFLEYIQIQMNKRHWQQGDLFHGERQDNIAVPEIINFYSIEEEQWFIDYFQQQPQEEFSVLILPVEYGHALTMFKQVAKKIHKKLNIHLLGGHLNRYSLWQQKMEFEDDYSQNLQGQEEYCSWQITWGDPRQMLSKIKNPQFIYIQIQHIEQAPEICTYDFWKKLFFYVKEETLLFSSCRDRNFRAIFHHLGLSVGEYHLSNHRNGTLVGKKLRDEDLLSNKEQQIMQSINMDKLWRDPQLNYSEKEILEQVQG